MCMHTHLYIHIRYVCLVCVSEKAMAPYSSTFFFFPFNLVLFGISTFTVLKE